MLQRIDHHSGKSVAVIDGFAHREVDQYPGDIVALAIEIDAANRVGAIFPLGIAFAFSIRSGFRKGIDRRTARCPVRLRRIGMQRNE